MSGYNALEADDEERVELFGRAAGRIVEDIARRKTSQHGDFYTRDS